MNLHTSSRSIASALVARGLVDPAREAEAADVVRDTLGSGGPADAPMRRRLAEIAAYVGGAFVVGAAALFVGAAWNDLTMGVRTALLLGSAVVLGVAGAVVVLTGRAPGHEVAGGPAAAVRRRLASVLLTGAAACAGFGVAVPLGDHLDSDLTVLISALVAVVVALGGYKLAPSTVGQLGVAVPAFVAIAAGTELAGVTTALPMAVLVVALGLLWLAATERGLWREADPGRVVGCGLALIGAQVAAFTDLPWLGYLGTLLLGAAAFGWYVARRAWPYLVTGVVAVTLAVPEAVNDWFGGSVGAAGVLLATGVALLGGAVLGLRMRGAASG